MEAEEHTWYLERISPGLAHLHGLRGLLYWGKTKYQRVEILDTSSYGTSLVLDGKTQSTEADEFIYHEALVHPALLAHPSPERVFIAGGGEGATLREVLAHKTVTSAVMVDLDAEVVQLCQERLPQWHQGAFQNQRTSLIYADAREVLQTTSTLYDVIISDITDPIEAGPSYLLFTQEFYRLAFQRLSPQGLIVIQAGFTTLTTDSAFPAIFNTIRNIFPVVVSYHIFIPSFGGEWGFVVGSKGPNPQALSPDEVDRRVVQRVTRPLRFYDGLGHQGMFSLPKAVREALAREKRVITEKEPLFTS